MTDPWHPTLEKKREQLTDFDASAPGAGDRFGDHPFVPSRFEMGQTTPQKPLTPEIALPEAWVAKKIRLLVSLALITLRPRSCATKLQYCGVLSVRSLPGSAPTVPARGRFEADTACSRSNTLKSYPGFTRH